MKPLLTLPLAFLLAAPASAQEAPKPSKPSAVATGQGYAESLIVRAKPALEVNDESHCALVLPSAPAEAAPAEPTPGGGVEPLVREEAPALTGDLRMDFLATAPEPLPDDGFFGSDGRRNPGLAFGMSALVPGLGQAYNGSWIRAAVAAGLEVGFWTGYVTWRGQGLDGTDAYQAFAHRDWSPVRYADWLSAYPGYSGPALNTASLQDIDFMNPDGWTGDERQRVLAFFDDLQAAERTSRYVNADGSGTGFTFSHVLDDFGEQQYYELIGKYFQYGPGWSDWCEGQDPDAPACYTIDGFEQQAAFEAKTDLFFVYADDHAEANTLLRRASRMTSLVLANHALAAIDALLTARFHNRGLDMEAGLSLRPDGRGGAQPVANLSLRF